YVEIWEEVGDSEYAKTVEDDLIFDLKLIADTAGQALWTKEAQVAMTEWDKSGRKPVPQHGRLLHYNSRRTVHVLKLAVISAMSRNNELSVTTEDFETALQWLIEA